MTKSPAEHAPYDLAQIAMKLPRMFGEARPPKRKWRVSADATVVGHTNRKKAIEFGAGSHAERAAIAWAEGLSDYATEQFAAEYPDLDCRHNQTHIGA